MIPTPNATSTHDYDHLAARWAMIWLSSNARNLHPWVCWYVSTLLPLMFIDPWLLCSCSESPVEDNLGVFPQMKKTFLTVRSPWKRWMDLTDLETFITPSCSEWGKWSNRPISRSSCNFPSVDLPRVDWNQSGRPLEPSDFSAIKKDMCETRRKRENETKPTLTSENSFFRLLSPRTCWNLALWFFPTDWTGFP
jgi:hypothetical protein